MTQDIQIGGDIITLDSEKLYSGKENPQGEEKLVRKALGLPVKKQLIFYKNKLDAESVTDIITYQLVKMHNITERWYTVEITSVDGNKARIHSTFLGEMQKPSFVADMIAQTVSEEK